MRLNENTAILGENVILVPYEAKHVEKYHKWMENPELREQTASERLSMEEELEMQKTWRRDDDKCTFLILDRKALEESRNELQSLIGDTNLFLTIGQIKRLAEAEIMIAEENARGKGYGKESMLLMLRYGVEHLKIDRFVVKIREDNHKSIRMFEALQFEETCRSSVFKEVTLDRPVTPEWLTWVKSLTEASKSIEYSALLLL